MNNCPYCNNPFNKIRVNYKAYSRRNQKPDFQNININGDISDAIKEFRKKKNTIMRIINAVAICDCEKPNKYYFFIPIRAIEPLFSSMSIGIKFPNNDEIIFNGINNPLIINGNEYHIYQSLKDFIKNKIPDSYKNWNSL